MVASYYVGFAHWQQDRWVESYMVWLLRKRGLMLIVGTTTFA